MTQTPPSAPSPTPTPFRIPYLPSMYQGIVLMILAMLCFGAMNNCVRFLSNSIPTEQVVLLRNVIALAVLSLWIFPQGVAPLRTRRIWSHIGRSTLGALSMHTWFYSLGHMPLADATALSFTTPIFVTVMAILFMGEHGTKRRWIAVGLGLVGTLVVLRPGSEAIVNPVAGMAILSSVLIAIISLWVKSLSRTETTSSMLFYMALIMTLIALPFGVLHWQPMSWVLWVAACIMAGTSLLAHSLLIEAYKHAEMTKLMPYDFTRLLFTSLFAYLLFGEGVDSLTLLGAAVIVTGSIIAAREKIATPTSATAQPSLNVAGAPPEIIARKDGGA
jgi:drug/metabolite transporter (DMT)-like permease